MSSGNNLNKQNIPNRFKSSPTVCKAPMNPLMSCVVRSRKEYFQRKKAERERKGKEKSKRENLRVEILPLIEKSREGKFCSIKRIVVQA